MVGPGVVWDDQSWFMGERGGSMARAQIVEGSRLSPAGRRPRLRRALDSKWAYMFVLPAMLVFAVFSIGPTIFSFVLSLFNWNYLNAAMSKFIGLQNYVDLVQGNRDPSFWSTMLVSAEFVVPMVIGGTVISLVLALLLSGGSKILYGARTVVFLANVTPFVGVSIVWVWLFNPRYGLVNAFTGLFGVAPHDWLGDPKTAMPAIVMFSLWHEVGFTLIVFLGGLTTLDKSLSEAAQIDRANKLQEIFYVVLPQLRPYTIFVIVMSTVFSLQAFTQFFVMTGGGPGFSTATLGFAVYQQAFIYRKTGYAAALAVVLFALTAVLSLLQLKASRRAGR